LLAIDGGVALVFEQPPGQGWVGIPELGEGPLAPTPALVGGECMSSGAVAVLKLSAVAHHNTPSSLKE
jgi:hypothetical protein